MKKDKISLFTFVMYMVIIALNFYYLGRNSAYSEMTKKKYERAEQAYIEAEELLSQAKVIALENEK